MEALCGYRDSSRCSCSNNDHTSGSSAYFSDENKENINTMHIAV